MGGLAGVWPSLAVRGFQSKDTRKGQMVTVFNGPRAGHCLGFLELVQGVPLIISVKLGPEN